MKKQLVNIDINFNSKKNDLKYKVIEYLTNKTIEENKNLEIGKGKDEIKENSLKNQTVNKEELNNKNNDPGIKIHELKNNNIIAISNFDNKKININLKENDNNSKGKIHKRNIKLSIPNIDSNKLFIFELDRFKNNYNDIELELSNYNKKFINSTNKNNNYSLTGKKKLLNDKQEDYFKKNNGEGSKKHIKDKNIENNLDINIKYHKVKITDEKKYEKKKKGDNIKNDDNQNKNIIQQKNETKFSRNKEKKLDNSNENNVFNNKYNEQNNFNNFSNNEIILEDVVDSSINREIKKYNRNKLSLIFEKNKSENLSINRTNNIYNNSLFEVIPNKSHNEKYQEALFKENKKYSDKSLKIFNNLNLMKSKSEETQFNIEKKKETLNKDDLFDQNGIIKDNIKLFEKDQLISINKYNNNERLIFKKGDKIINEGNNKTKKEIINQVMKANKNSTFSDSSYDKLNEETRPKSSDINESDNLKINNIYLKYPSNFNIEIPNDKDKCNIILEGSLNRDYIYKDNIKDNKEIFLENTNNNQNEAFLQESSYNNSIKSSLKSELIQKDKIYIKKKLISEEKIIDIKRFDKTIEINELLSRYLKYIINDKKKRIIIFNNVANNKNKSNDNKILKIKFKSYLKILKFLSTKGKDNNKIIKKEISNKYKQYILIIKNFFKNYKSEKELGIGINNENKFNNEKNNNYIKEELAKMVKKLFKKINIIKSFYIYLIISNTNNNSHEIENIIIKKIEIVKQQIEEIKNQLVIYIKYLKSKNEEDLKQYISLILIDLEKLMVINDKEIEEY